MPAFIWNPPRRWSIRNASRASTAPSEVPSIGRAEGTATGAAEAPAPTTGGRRIVTIAQRPHA